MMEKILDVVGIVLLILCGLAGVGALWTQRQVDRAKFEKRLRKEAEDA